MTPESHARDVDAPSGTVSEVMAELAEAEAAEAEARAQAARAKATAVRLRGAAAESDDAPEPETAIAAEVAGDAEAEPSRRRWSRLPWRWIVPAAAVLAIAGLLTATGLMVWQHRQAGAQRADRAAFVTAARDGVVALLSIDHSRARADVQRVIDSSTGAFRDDFTKNADDFVKTAEESDAVTQGTVTAAALESVDGDSGVVMVAAKSQVTNSNGASQDPRAWRMSVTVSRDGGQLKISNVEFVP